MIKDREGGWLKGHPLFAVCQERIQKRVDEDARVAAPGGSAGGNGHMPLVLIVAAGVVGFGGMIISRRKGKH